ncbi:MAG: hypothetical protein CM1200mP16_15600 [Nitrospina sp.]|nr:MAG: hypothetical protein CM1200mP16_15600 [Nitrospina sp.]
MAGQADPKVPQSSSAFTMAGNLGFWVPFGIPYKILVEIM